MIRLGLDGGERETGHRNLYGTYVQKKVFEIRQGRYYVFPNLNPQTKI